MVQIEGVFQHIKNENFVEYLTSIGIPEDKARIGNSVSPKLTVVIDEEKISFNSDSAVPNSSSTFVLGNEIDEPMPGGIILKSKATLDGDVLTVFSKTPKGTTGTRTYKFSDTELILTMESQGAPVGKRVYKRL